MAACIFRSFLCAFIFAISSAISLSQDFSGVIARNSLASDFEGQKRLEALGGITGANYVKTSHLSVEGGDATAISGRIWIPEKQ